MYGYGYYGATQVKKPVAPTAKPVARPVAKPVAKPVAVAPKPVAPAPISTPSASVTPSKTGINPVMIALVLAAGAFWWFKIRKQPAQA